MTAGGDSLDLDLVAASLRADSGDIDAFLEGLARKLEEVVPGRARVERARRGLLGPKAVREIALESGGVSLSLRREADGLEAVRARVSGGIVLKRDRIDPDEWIGEVVGLLGEEAGRSARTREALERLLLG